MDQRNGPSEKRLLPDYEDTIRKARELVSEAESLRHASRNLIGLSRQLMQDFELTEEAVHSRKPSRIGRWLHALELITQERNGRALPQLLDLAVEITGAEFGNIQLFDESKRVLRIVASRGFDGEFLDYFAAVRTTECACGSAMRQKRRVVVSDVKGNPLFSRESRDVILRANVRACQSTPLFSSSGRLLGMVSTHYASPRRPPMHALPFLDLLARRSEKIFA